ncbi:MAG: rRNA maturation RNase YbeY [Patescibacteria group bacterium]|jgi:rRNA maturation RNase YbeY
MINIDINNKVVGVKIDKRLVEKVASAVSRSLVLKKERCVSLVLVGDAVIRKLNKTYRKKDKITDVLSFEYLDKNFVGSTEDYLGEIFICYPQIKRQAVKNGNSIKKEFALLLIHGLVHLFGYDHEKSVKDERFFDKQQKTILQKIGL